MFEILNRYCHGLASIPVFRALREAGCLSRLADGEPRSAGELAREFGGNSAYVEVALRMLLGVGWVRSAPGDRYVAVSV
jgi:DNA-binding IclR family transcriptional regulator